MFHSQWVNFQFYSCLNAFTLKTLLLSGNFRNGIIHLIISEVLETKWQKVLIFIYILWITCYCLLYKHAGECWLTFLKENRQNWINALWIKKIFSKNDKIKPKCFNLMSSLQQVIVFPQPNLVHKVQFVYICIHGTKTYLYHKYICFSPINSSIHSILSILFTILQFITYIKVEYNI